MPELPEVEIAARSLAAQVLDRQISAVEKLDWERMVETPDLPTFLACLPGRHIHAVGRRAKWLLLPLDAGWTLALHLRMSGHISVQSAEAVPNVYTHLVLALDDGRRIFFEDQRKFGRARLLDPAGLAALDAGLGPEPLSADFTAVHLAQMLAKRPTRLKPLLLNQAFIAGLGNIYVDESLWLAQLHPCRPANSLDAAEVERLYTAIRTVLEQGIQNKGSTLRNYRNGYGERGQNQEHFAVYDRNGYPCLRCGTPVERLVVAQRGTHICPACQVATAPLSISLGTDP
jgi:formamidopyrimidine-DNA glycosylase